MTRIGKNSLIVAVAVGCGAAAMVFAVVSATGQDRSASPILHEDLTPPADQVARTAARAAERQAGAAQSMLGPDPTAGQNPQAISAGPKILPEPNSKAPRAPGETVFGEKSFGADRDTETRPDYATGADGTLHYVEVFNPSVVPFKRMTALDEVGPGYSLVTDSRSTTEVPVGGARRAGRELFWGSISVALETGKEIAMPSVSADMGILSYEIDPVIPLVFSKDRADNFFVRTDEPGVVGTYRLVFLADAASSHFSPRIPKTIKVSELPKRLVRAIPAAERKVANRALARLGLTPRTGLKVALDELTRYFRSFEAKDPPNKSGDIFWDLFSAQAGVCRHRSFVFMVTANALGIPTRYVANEAHAWVEVFVPTQGWVRIDLGGAALRLEVSGAKDKAMHSGGNDPFPKPEKYENNYTQLVGDVDGLTSDQIEERRQGSLNTGSNNSGDSSGGASGGGDGDGDGDGDFFDQSEEATTADGRDDRGQLIGPGNSLPTISDDQVAGKKPTAITVEEASVRGYRGEAMRVSGTLSSEGTPLADHMVNIFLMRVGEDESIRIGTAKTTADGSYSAELQIPSSLPLAGYEVYASTPGDDAYAPSLSD